MEAWQYEGDKVRYDPKTNLTYSPEQRKGANMSSVDLNNFSVPELEELSKAIASELERRQTESKRIVLNQIKELAQSIGMTIDDVVGIGKRKQRRGAPVPSKVYVNPENPKETWSGRGRRPNWVRDILSRGETLNTLDAS